jgi:hypothetical protein
VQSAIIQRQLQIAKRKHIAEWITKNHLPQSPIARVVSVEHRCAAPKHTQTPKLLACEGTSEQRLSIEARQCERRYHRGPAPLKETNLSIIDDADDND